MHHDKPSKPHGSETYHDKLDFSKGERVARIANEILEKLK